MKSTGKIVRRTSSGVTHKCNPPPRYFSHSHSQPRFSAHLRPVLHTAPSDPVMRSTPHAWTLIRRKTEHVAMDGGTGSGQDRGRSQAPSERDWYRHRAAEGCNRSSATAKHLAAAVCHGVAQILTAVVYYETDAEDHKRCPKLGDNIAKA